MSDNDDNQPLLADTDALLDDGESSFDSSDDADVQAPAVVASSTSAKDDSQTKRFTVSSLAEQEDGRDESARRVDARAMADARREREQRAYQEETVSFFFYSLSPSIQPLIFTCFLSQFWAFVVVVVVVLDIILFF
jgi:VIT1/CCC1 family predicted Fe2+/Mn2+ transporter